jgi:endoglucanase
MKQFLILIIAIAVAAIAHGQPVKQHGQLRVQGTQLVNKKGKPVVLHGMSFGWHNLWPRFYNKGAVKELVKKWNCTVIRASMGIELNDRGYLKSPEQSTNLMQHVIDACIKQGVYVIIDWHDHNIHTGQAKAFFAAMSKKYASYPNIIYEIYNEPDHESWPEVKKYSEEVIAAIRQNDKHNIILVGSPRWDQEIHLPAADPIKGYDNLMYTMHFYAGTHKQWLRNRTDSAMAKGLPIFVSECAGMEATGNGPLDVEEWNRFKAWMDERKISWVAWSVSDKNETCSVLKPSAASDGNWKEEDIKEWGRISKAALNNYFTHPSANSGR